MNLVVAVAKLAIVAMFFLSGVFKMKNFKPTVAGFVGKTGASQTVAVFAVAAAAALQLVASSLIAYNAVTDRKKKWARFAAYALAVFTVAATAIYHFPPTGRTYYPFISNVCTVGALLLLGQKI